MKKLTGIFCVVFLYMMAGTLIVYADDRSFESGAGITFEGSYPEEPKDAGTSKGSKSAVSKMSLPQTGQEASMVLPAAGCAVLILVCWWGAEKHKGYRLQRGKVPLSD